MAVSVHLFRNTTRLTVRLKKTHFFPWEAINFACVSYKVCKAFDIV